ncbi:hypothetical protein [Kocuria sp.]|uniref:hypothetical protein n=1 Tax=Kocuria sp. TaxID=1871328 RepID=UPI0026E0B799|nr:hypothetical protein [Kocuria sp.]MDO5619463.1 hypothetical protein [Kocuria sp.]
MTPSPDGGTPVWAVPVEGLAEPVTFTGRVVRPSGVEVFLEAVDERYRVLWEDPSSDIARTYERQMVSRALMGLEAMPQEAMWEWHCATPEAAASLMRLFKAEGLYGQLVAKFTPREGAQPGASSMQGGGR